MEENNKKNKRKSAIEKIEKQNQKIERMVSRNFMNDAISNMSNTMLGFADILQKNSMANVLGDIATQMSAVNIINEILPPNYISDIVQSVNIQNNLLKGLYPESLFEINKIFESIGLQEYRTTIFEKLTKGISNLYYTDTIKDCVSILANSKINISDLLVIEELNDDLIEDIENFNEENKEEIEENIKEISDIASNSDIATNKEKKNIEQKIKEKWDEIVAKHPLTAALIIHILLEIITNCALGAFTQDSNQYYIKNYTTNIINVVQIEENTDFINNARYVTAKNLNVREGPGKEFKVVASLKYGDVIKVLDKTKYWTKIEYNDVENKVNIKGWVYTRYITSFDSELLEIDVSEEK